MKIEAQHSRTVCQNTLAGKYRINITNAFGQVFSSSLRFSFPSAMRRAKDLIISKNRVKAEIINNAGMTVYEMQS